VKTISKDLAVASAAMSSEFSRVQYRGFGAGAERARDKAGGSPASASVGSKSTAMSAARFFTALTGWGWGAGGRTPEPEFFPFGTSIGWKAARVH